MGCLSQKDVAWGGAAISLEEVVSALAEFFAPILGSDLTKTWSPGGPWL